MVCILDTDSDQDPFRIQAHQDKITRIIVSNYIITSSLDGHLKMFRQNGQVSGYNYQS